MKIFLYGMRAVCVLCVWPDLLLTLWVNKQWIKLSKNHFVRKRSVTWRTYDVGMYVFVYVSKLFQFKLSWCQSERESLIKKKEREFVTINLSIWMKKKKVCVGEHNTIWLWMVTNNKSQWTKNRNASKPNIYRVKINIRWRIQAIMNYDFLYSFFFHSFSVCVLIFILPLHFRQKEKKRLKLNSAGKSRSCYVHRMKWNKMIRMNYHLVWSHSKRMSHWYTFGTILMKGISIYVDAIFFFLSFAMIP